MGMERKIIAEGQLVDISDEIYENLSVAGSGGAISNCGGTITLNNVTLQTATDTIYNSGTLSLTGHLNF